MADTVAGFAARMDSAASGIGRANRVGVEKACLFGKQVMQASMTAAGIGTRVSGVGRKGARVGVRYDVKGFKNPVGIIRYVGPVHLVNSGTVPHYIYPRKRGKKALSPRGNPWAAASAFHPGTKGKKFAEKAEPVVLAQARKIVTDEARAHLARTFAG